MILPEVQASGDLIVGLKQWRIRKNAIREENERLIAEWNAIPWWRFWERPSFKQQSDIISRNWQSLRPYEYYKQR